jgi:hypothetical protein
VSLAELGALGEFVGSIVTVATLIYLAIQVRLYRAQQKREANVAIQHGQNSVVALLQEPAMARAYARTAAHGRAAPIEDRSRAVNWVLQYLNHFQIVYDLYEDGTLDRERYELWEGFAVSIVAPAGVREWWDGESGKLAFMPEVRELIDRRLADDANPPVPLNELWSVHDARSWDGASAEGRPG